MIAEMTGVPSVARFDGKIAVYAVDDGENHGFLLPAAAATETATQILAAVADLAGRGSYAMPVGNVAVESNPVTGDVRITFDIGGAPLAAVVDPTQLAELAAGLAAASREVDRPRR